MPYLRTQRSGLSDTMFLVQVIVRPSERFGMVADLCHYCHNEPPNGVHHNRENDLRLKREYQAIFEAQHGHDAFMQVFGRNYL